MEGPPSWFTQTALQQACFSTVLYFLRLNGATRTTNRQGRPWHGLESLSSLRSYREWYNSASSGYDTEGSGREGSKTATFSCSSFSELAKRAEDMSARKIGNGEERVYAAAQEWVNRALRGDDSLFTPGAAIWTGHWLNRLHDLYNQQADPTVPGYYGKLEGSIFS